LQVGYARHSINHPSPVILLNMKKHIGERCFFSCIRKTIEAMPLSTSHYFNFDVSICFFSAGNYKILWLFQSTPKKLNQADYEALFFKPIRC